MSFQPQVLIVEDNRVNQIVLSKQLQKLGVTFAVTPSGPQALEVWENSQDSISVILMDVEIEGELNGLQVTSLIRKRQRETKRTRRPYVAIMTGRALEEDKQAAFDSGCDEFLVKPVPLEKIRQLLDVNLL